MTANGSGDNGNIYFRARKAAAGYNKRLTSRDAASELLGYGASTLAGYELGTVKTVPPEAVMMMADLYCAPELRNQYCSLECPIGKGSPIATDVGSIDKIAVRLIKAQNSLDKAKADLIDIASGPDITHDKLPLIVALLQCADEMISPISELKLMCQKVLAHHGVCISHSLNPERGI